jgi:adenylyltransferase/sulfurtransferase
MIYDALAMTYRTISVRKDPATPKITELVDYAQFCGTSLAAVETDATVTPTELQALLASDGRYVLIDVREPAEWEINHIDGARLIPKSLIESGEGLALIPADRIPVLYCKTGVRSAEVLDAVKGAGFADALHLHGGIVAWGTQFEPDMVMY